MDKKELFELSDNVLHMRHKINDIDSLIESKSKAIEISKKIMESPIDARLEVNGDNGHVSTFIEKEVFVKEVVEFTLQMLEKEVIDLQNQRAELDQKLVRMAESINGNG